MTARSLFVALLVVVSPPCRAATCTADRSLNACFDSIREIATDAELSESGMALVTELNEATTSVTTMEAGTAASVLNLLPRLTVTGLVAPDEGDDSGDLLGFDYNFKLPTHIGAGHNTKLHFEIDRQPEVFVPLRAALDETTTEGLVTDLENTLETFDDLAVSFTYSITNQRFGRTFSPHRNDYESMYRQFFDEIYENPESEIREKQTAAVGMLTRELAEGCIDLSKFSNEVPIAQWVTCKEEHGRAVDVLQAQFRSTVDFLRTVDAGIDSYEITKFSQLLNNQPQLNFSAFVRERDDLVGPSEQGLMLSYEMGVANLNSMRKKCGAAFDHACFRDYVTDEVSQEALEKGDRLSFSLEWSHLDDYRFTLPAQNFLFEQGGSDKFSATFAYGRLVRLGNAESDSARIDISASYQNSSDDFLLNDRGIASFTLTKRLGAITLPFTIVWATEPEFRGEVDTELSARLGIKYDLSPAYDN